MTIRTCNDCKHYFGTQCRRYPPPFPEATAPCGEYVESEEAAERRARAEESERTAKYRREIERCRFTHDGRRCKLPRHHSPTDEHACGPEIEE